MVDFNPSAMADAVSNGALLALQQIGAVLPQAIFNVIVAIIVLLIGFFVSSFLGRLTEKIIEYIGAEKVFRKYKLEDALGGTHITHFFALFVKWFVMLFFLSYALRTLNFGMVTDYITSLMLYVPVVLGSALLVIVAAIVGEWVREAIMGVHKFYLQATIATATKWLIVLSAVMVGLETIGFKMQFVYILYNSILGSVSNGLAIAFGLAFGLGGQKDAADIIRKVRRKFSF